MNKRYKTHKWTLLVLLAALGLFLPLPLAEGVTEQFQAGVEVSTTVLQAPVFDDQLMFGTITAHPTCLTFVRIVPGPSVLRQTFGSKSICSSARPTVTGTFQPARYSVSGAPNAFYTITVPANQSITHLFFGCGFLCSVTLTVGSYQVFSVNRGVITLLGQLNSESTGTESIRLGALLSVPAGSYTVTLTATTPSTLTVSYPP